MGDPKVSIIIPNFNGEKYIRETLQSVVEQSYTNFETIIVDDGSDDNSIEIIKEFLSNKVSFYRREPNAPKGANACRNIGIEKSQGEYLIFLDSDDLLDCNCLKNRVDFMNENNELLFAVFNSKKFWDDVNQGVVFTRLNGYDPIRHFLCTDNLWQTSSVIWRRDFIISIGGFNLLYQRLQDPEITMRALLASEGKYKLVSDSFPDTYYRRPQRLGNYKMSRSYYANLQYINDFYIDENCAYLDKNNTAFMFYLVSKMHFQYCTNEDDNKKYLKSIDRLIKYNPSLGKSIILKICRNKRLFRICRNKLFTFILRIYFYSLEVRIKDYDRK